MTENLSKAVTNGYRDLLQAYGDLMMQVTNLTMMSADCALITVDSAVLLSLIREHQERASAIVKNIVSSIAESASNPSEDKKGE